MDARANWDDLRFVLAVADAGSVAAAARMLAVNHATVLRRIAAFETRHGLHIFDKTAQGYRVAEDRRGLIEAMREAGGALAAVERLIADERPAVGTAIRITTTDSLSCGPLPGICAQLARAQKANVDFSMSNAHTDFARLQADIAVRPAPRLPDDLPGDSPVSLHFAVFESDGGGEDLDLGLSGRLGRIAGHLDPTKAATRSDSFVALANMAQSGRGRAILPTFLGRAIPGLRQTDRDAGLAPVPIWVASHKDIFRSARLLRARRFIFEALEAEADLFAP
jgi:DNA-binding transcriptional LysR family regulator